MKGMRILFDSLQKLQNTLNIYTVILTPSVSNSPFLITEK